MDYAVFRSGGRQYKAAPGAVIDVDRLAAESGSYLEINDVLAVSHKGDVVVGDPLVPNASVIAQVESHGQDDKIIVFKYKRKVRYRRKKGHRQQFTRILVTSIMLGEEEIGIVEDAEIEEAVAEVLMDDEDGEDMADIEEADEDTTVAEIAEDDGAADDDVEDTEAEEGEES
jgi:large subunit ribosomal protein L21